MNIDWENKPDWAEVWLEAINPSEREWGGWHKSEDDKWVDASGFYWYKEVELLHDRGFTAHYPPTKQEEMTNETI